MPSYDYRIMSDRRCHTFCWKSRSWVDLLSIQISSSIHTWSRSCHWHSSGKYYRPLFSGVRQYTFVHQACHLARILAEFIHASTTNSITRPSEYIRAWSLMNLRLRVYQQKSIRILLDIARTHTFSWVTLIHATKSNNIPGTDTQCWH